MKIYNKNIIMYCTCAMKLISRWNWIINWSNDQLTLYRIRLSDVFFFIKIRCNLYEYLSDYNPNSNFYIGIIF
jgi:hypothetical protein